MNKILETRWFSGRFHVVFVLIENSIGEQSVRLGSFNPELGNRDEAQNVGDFGMKLSFQEAKGFFPEIEESNYKKN